MRSGWEVTNRRGQLVRQLKNGKSSVVSGQRLLPGPSLSADLPPTSAASGCHGAELGTSSTSACAAVA